MRAAKGLDGAMVGTPGSMLDRKIKVFEVLVPERHYFFNEVRKTADHGHVIASHQEGDIFRWHSYEETTQP